MLMFNRWKSKHLAWIRVQIEVRAEGGKGGRGSTYLYHVVSLKSSRLMTTTYDELLKVACLFFGGCFALEWNADVLIGL